MFATGRSYRFAANDRRKIMAYHILKTAHLYAPFAEIPDALLAWDEKGVIVYSGPGKDAPKLDGTLIAYERLTAVPGWIDIHVHGGWGVQFGTGNRKEELHKYSEFALRAGVSGFLVTIAGPSHDAIITMIESYVPLLADVYSGALPLGLHLEGPFLNPERHGAFNPDWLQKPALSKMRDYVDAAQGWLRQVSLAPELEHVFEVAKFLRQQGIRVALAHSSADYETAAKALAGDFSHVTHTFNAQSAFHHRKPGVVGAILTSKDATAELIADSVHVHPAAMQVLVRCLGPERIVLITDAMPGAGLGDGAYDLIGQTVVVENGSAFLPDGTLAGSAATMDRCVRNMAKQAGVTPLQACHMASTNPAAVIGMEDRIGSLAPGHYADITLVNQNLEVEAVFVRGVLRYQSSSS